MSSTTAANVTSLLLRRELGGAFPGPGTKSCTVREREKGLHEWATNEASRHCFSECCALNNTPRSTIAATINKDGTLIASTHGDHTVKIVRFATGTFEKELVGHRRTPWTVKFHPTHSHLLVSGSLDNEIRLWDIELGTCLQSKDFGHQISSVSFHPTGKVLAIAAGHKLHVWEFNEEEGRFGNATCVFRTTRTIRTVHFSPTGGMIMASERVEPHTLSAEALRTGTRSATEYVPVMQHPPHVPWNEFPQDPWVRGGQGHPPVASRGGSNTMFPVLHNSAMFGNPSEPSQLTRRASGYLPLSSAPAETRTSDSILRQMGQYTLPLMQFPSLEILPAVQRANPSDDTLHQFPDPQRLPTQQQAGSSLARLRGNNPRPLHIAHPQTLPVLSLMPMNNGNVDGARNGQLNEMPRPPLVLWNQQPNAMMPQAAQGPGNNDLPHVTKLVLYEYDVQKPHATLNQELLRVDKAVICSETGAHISACGRMMVICVAFPRLDRHISGHPGFLYELHVISLERQNFGELLRSRSISAGHCLTSVQFSPGSDMILLSYGRKHASLLRRLERNGSTVAQQTLLELYSAKTLTLLRVMHSAEDEANTASFHPFAGEGIIYGTKNGKLKILRHKRTHSSGDGDEAKDDDNELPEALEDELE